MKWIDVRERLPEESDWFCAHEYLLVLGEDDDEKSLIGIGRYLDNKWEFMGNVNMGVYSDTGTWPFKPEEITHWMLFPNFPNNERN